MEMHPGEEKREKRKEKKGVCLLGRAFSLSSFLFSLPNWFPRSTVAGGLGKAICTTAAGAYP